MLRNHGQVIRFRNAMMTILFAGCLLLPGLLLSACPDLVGQWPYGFSEALDLQGTYAYVGLGSTFVVADISDPTNPTIAAKLNVDSFRNAIRGITINGTYAYISVYQNLRIVDISTPTAPVLVDTFAMSDIITDVRIYGTIAYVGTFRDGLTILDLTNPVAPTIMGTCDTSGNSYSVDVTGTIACVADWTGGMSIINVADPYIPVEITSVPTPAAAQDVRTSGDTVFLTNSSYGVYIYDISTPSVPVHLSTYNTAGGARGLDLVGSTLYVADDYSGFTILNVSDRLNPAFIGSHDTGGRASRVHQDGNYLYVADYWDGLVVFDISTPSSPSRVGQLYEPWWSEHVVPYGNYTYHADYFAGLRIIDISDPVEPVEVALYDTPAYPRGVDAAGGYLYLTDSNDGLWIYDLTNPIAPALTGSCLTPGTGQDVMVEGGFAYVSDGSDGLRIIDVSDPFNPVEIGFIDTPGTAHATDVYGDTAYVADQDGGLRIINISDPTAPVEIGDFPTAGLAIDVKASSGLAYVAVFYEGHQIVDVTNPAAPFEVGLLDTYGPSRGIDVSGGYAYLAGMNQGVFIQDISNPTLPIEVGIINTPDDANDIYVVGNTLYVSDQEGGLFILDVNDCCVNPPADFALTAPADGAGGQACSLTLNWTDSTEALSYDIYFDTVTPPSLLVENYPWSEYPVTLAPGTTYYWKIAARNGCGTTEPPIQSFAITPLPASFAPLSPADGASGQLTTLTLDWENSASASSYDLYLGTGSPLPLYQDGIPGSSLEVTGLDPDTAYTWYIVAANSCGTSQSFKRSFTTGITMIEYFAHNVVDTCSVGGSGDLNSIAEPGEELALTVTLHNSGTLGATGVTALLSTLNPHVSILTNSDVYPDLPSGGMGSSITAYTVGLSELTPCPSTIDIVVSITSNEGSWADSFQIQVGQPGTLLLNETFETWPPSGWQIVDNVGSCEWSSTAITGRPNYAGGDGAAADADSDWCGSVDGMDTELITPSLNLSQAITASLNFTAAYRDLEARAVDYFNVDISTNGGTDWTSLLSWNESHDPFGPGEEVSLDLYAFSGSADTRIRFHYVATAWDWYALIDTVYVSYTPPCTFCDSYGPPGETAQNGSFTLTKNIGDLDFSWAAPGGTCDPTEYGIYTGDIASLASGYGHDTALVCAHGGTSFSLALNDADLNLAAGQYFLVVSGNGIQEGAYGSSTADQPRPVSTASCTGGEQDMTECNP